MPLVGTMFVGKGADSNIGAGANITGLGTLTLGLGNMDVNTLQVGVSVTVAGTGTVNANGGTLLANTLLRTGQNGFGSSGTLNISGAVVTANNAGITVGVWFVVATIGMDLAGGTLNATRTPRS